MANTCIILNRRAGSAASLGADFAEHCRAAGIRLLSASRAKSAVQLALDAVHDGATHLILAGGDGTIHKVIAALTADLNRLTFGIVPLGTGNDLARCLDLPRDDPAAALELALHAGPRPIDLIACQSSPLHPSSPSPERESADPSRTTTSKSLKRESADPPRTTTSRPLVRESLLAPSPPLHQTLCLNLISGGFESADPRATDAERKRRFGPFAYWLDAARKLTDIVAHRVTFTADEKTESIDAYGMAIANGRYLGGGFRIAPQALLDDGLLDLVLFPVQSSLELLSAGIDTLLNRQEESDKIFFRQAAGIEIAAVPPVSFRADGEPLGEVNLVCEVRPQALRVVCGQQPHCVTDPPPPLQKGE